MKAPALPASVGLGAGVALVALVAIAGLSWWLYANRDKLNPLSEANLANQAVSGTVAAVTGGAAAGGEDSLGGLFSRAREWLSGDDAAIRALKAGAPQLSAAPQPPAQWVSP